MLLSLNLIEALFLTLMIIKTEVKKGVIIVFTRTNEAIAQVIDRCQLKCIQEGLCCPRSYLREHMGYIKTTLFH